MPMTISGMQAAIVAQLNTQFGTPADTTQQTKFANAIATAVVDYIQANMLITTTDVGTVTSGPGSGGTVTATGTGTAS